MRKSKKTPSTEGRPEPLPPSSAGEPAKQGGSMGLWILLLACVLMAFIGIWGYTNSEDTAFHKTKDKIAEVDGQVNALQNSIDQTKADAERAYQEAMNGVSELTKQVAVLQSKYDVVIKELEFTQKVSKRASKECDRVQDHNAKIRDSLLAMEKEVATKKQVEPFKGPFVMEVFVNPKSKNSGVPRKRKTTKKEEK